MRGDVWNGRSIRREVGGAIGVRWDEQSEGSSWVEQSETAESGEKSNRSEVRGAIGEVRRAIGGMWEEQSEGWWEEQSKGGGKNNRREGGKTNLRKMGLDSRYRPVSWVRLLLNVKMKFDRRAYLKWNDDEAKLGDDNMIYDYFNYLLIFKRHHEN